MVLIHTLEIDPPLLNSSCLWASDLEQLRALYDSPHTGAVTTRTATLDGYKEDASNTVVFTTDRYTTLNTYGYSPHPLATYLDWIFTLLTSPSPKRKPIILSITTSSPTELSTMLEHIQALRTRLRTALPRSPDPAALLAVELNTSCPNIPGAPPPAHTPALLRPLLAALAPAAADPSLTLGLKLPPYPDPSAPPALLALLAALASPVAFLTCTNTLGACALFADQVAPADQAAPAPGAFARGALGGAPLHALALGTVLAFARGAPRAGGAPHRRRRRGRRGGRGAHARGGRVRGGVRDAAGARGRARVRAARARAGGGTVIDIRCGGRHGVGTADGGRHGHRDGTRCT